MESKKDIGSYFKENLENLDYAPSQKVWDGIEAELKQKKKRRFFFWMFFAVIAVIGFSTYSFFNNSNSEKPSVNTVATTDSNTNSAKSNSNNDNSGKSNPNNINSGKSASGNTNSEGFNSGKTNLHNLNEKGSNKIKGNDLVNNENAKSRKNNLNGKANAVIKNNSKAAVANNNVAKAKPNNALGVFGKRDKLLTRNSEKGKISSAKKIKNTKKGKASLIAQNTHSKHSKRRKNPTGSQPEKEVLLTTLSQSKKDSTVVDLSSLQNKDLGKLDDKAVTKKADSISTKKNKDLVKNINMYKKEKKDSVPVLTYKKFDFDVFVSPTYYGYFSKKSTLDPRLDSLSKKSQMRFSYGVGISYDLSKRASFRIGYRKVNLTYVTQNVPIDTLYYSGVQYNPNVSNHTIMDGFNALQMPDGSEAFPARMNITQKISYTEIPFEFKYKFIDKKLSIKSSVGFSYLILNQNTVSIKTLNGFALEIGKTWDLSKTGLTFNLGIEADYPLFKNMKMFVEPMFNYQAKAFSSSNFNPYFFGVNTGLRYSFNN